MPSRSATATILGSESHAAEAALHYPRGLKDDRHSHRQFVAAAKQRRDSRRGGARLDPRPKQRPRYRRACQSVAFGETLRRQLGAFVVNVERLGPA